MSAVRTYLDHNATSPLRPEAREEMMRALDVSGNASSVHAEGRTARALIEAARTKIAALAGAAPRDVVFTSGATEAANWVMAQPWQVVLVSAVEHAAVMAPALRCGARVEIIPVDGAGRVDPEGLGELIDAVCGDGGVSVAGAVLVAVQHANNESGVVQPIAKIAEIARERGVRLIVDAVQAAGRLALDQRGQGIDFMVLSSHKIGGPQGAGALVIGNEASIDPMLVGGGQERSLRAGTENVAAIAGFGAAAAASERDLARSAHLARLRDTLERDLKRATPELIVIGGAADRLCNTTLVARPGARAETVVIGLDLAGVGASAGAACSSGKINRSPVLAAMGIGEEIGKCAVRFSLGWTTTEDDIAQCVSAWERVNKTRSGARAMA